MAGPIHTTNCELPSICIDGNASFFICPLCSGSGVTYDKRDEQHSGQWFTHERKLACSHCFGFGRLPVPSWYREQGGER